MKWWTKPLLAVIDLPRHVDQSSFLDPDDGLIPRQVDQSSFLDPDDGLMLLALVEAVEAAERDETPIGAVVKDGWGRVVAQSGNQTLTTLDPTAHAEIMALRLATSRLGDFRLPGYGLYVTLQPCPMCEEALRQARIGHVRYAARRLLVESPLPVSRVEQQEDGGAGAVLLHHFFRQRRL